MVEDEDEWDSLMPEGTLANVMGASVTALEGRPRDVEVALNEGDVIGARLGAARRLNQVLLEYEQRMRQSGLDSESMKVLVKGYETFEKMAGAAQKDMSPKGGDKADTTGQDELKKALAGGGGRPAPKPRKALAVVSGGAHVEDAEFVVDEKEVAYGDLRQWAGAKFAALPFATVVLEMLRHGATADMVREVYPEVTTWQLSDCRKYSEKLFGKGFLPPAPRMRNRGGWYRGPHKDRFKMEAAP